MNDLRERLLRCFAAAFPDVAEEALPILEAKATEEWDSVATATVFALVQEEFGIELEVPEELEQLDSFSNVYEFVARRLAR
jgi:acyl carrier protein